VVVLLSPEGSWYSPVEIVLGMHLGHSTYFAGLLHCSTGLGSGYTQAEAQWYISPNGGLRSSPSTSHGRSADATAP